MDADIIFCILDCLDLCDLLSCSSINKKFNKVSKNELIWKRLCEIFPIVKSGYRMYYEKYYKLNKFLGWTRGRYQVSSTTLEFKCLCVPGKNLESLLPEIGLLTNLKELHLFNNKLRSLPREIGLLVELRK